VHPKGNTAYLSKHDGSQPAKTNNSNTDQILKVFTTSTMSGGSPKAEGNAHKFKASSPEQKQGPI